MRSMPSADTLRPAEAPAPPERPIRILQMVGRMNRAGAETLVMNLYRRMDRTCVQFDFAVTTSQKGHYDDEIRELGGRVIAHPEPASAGFRSFAAQFRQTLTGYGPYRGVHSHVHLFSGYVLKLAHEAGVPIRVAHSHT